MVTFQRLEADNGEVLYRLYQYNNHGDDIEYGLFQEDDFLDMCEAVIAQYEKIEAERTAKLKAEQTTPDTK